MIDQTIVLARRHGPALSWQEIGDALGVSGQAADSVPQPHDLAVDPIAQTTTSAASLRPAQLCANDPDGRVQTSSVIRPGDFEHRHLEQAREVASDIDDAND